MGPSTPRSNQHSVRPGATSSPFVRPFAHPPIYGTVKSLGFYHLRRHRIGLDCQVNRISNSLPITTMRSNKSWVPILSCARKPLILPRRFFLGIRRLQRLTKIVDFKRSHHAPGPEEGVRDHSRPRLSPTNTRPLLHK